MLGLDYSSKFSAYLAHGCLSPRYIADEVYRYENENGSNKSTYWLIFELLWRDFFRFFSMKHGKRIFFPGGAKSVRRPWRNPSKDKQARELFDAWCNGRTGRPLVDANMRELLATGFMSNRGRQNVASYLVLDLGIDWRYGAEWFESLLIDHDVTANYGN